MLDKLFKKLKILKRKFKYKKKSYSFGGVDLLIDYIFKNINKGFYIDIGCQHPISNNNTYLLFKKGWSGINIDLDQTNIDLFNIERPIDINICSALSSEEGIEKLYFFHNGSPINSLNQSISNLNKSKIKNVTDIKVNILNNFLEKIKDYEGKLFFINSNDTRHNIFGLWSIDLLERLEKDLDNGERKVEMWANKIGVKSINMKFENKDPFFNINTKEDLTKAEEYLEND